MEIPEAREIAKLFASKFIVRPDLRAIQLANGAYEPMRPNPNQIGGTPRYSKQEGFDMSSLLDHIAGTKTYGHYMIGTADEVKFFCLDIDLEQTGQLPSLKFGEEYVGWEVTDPRAFWMSRQRGPGREIIKLQLKMVANKLARIITDYLEIPVAVAYSGSKGVHVYGFTGVMSAKLAREGAEAVVKGAGWELFRGQNFYRYSPDKEMTSDPIFNFHQYSLEVYPKQDSLDGKDIGNLLRLPLGKNLKSPKDVPFFLDMRTALSDFSSMSPIEALTTTDMWRYEGE